jgi:hypothetical protein
MNILKAFIRWLYRDSGTGRFLSKSEFDKRDRKTTQRERVMRDHGDTL